MSTIQITCGTVAAVLLFWAVGAHNRLVGLRNVIVRCFAPIDAQLELRQVLLQQQIEALGSLLANAGSRVDALRAACQQADAACRHAKVRPGSVGAIASLRLAEDILAESRARLPLNAAPGTGLVELNTRLAAVDTTLSFARRQFNDAVVAYNQAVRQFPTRLIARVFSFRAAGML